MGWDPVPYMVGGGASHSTNVMRTIAHAAFDGKEGVVNATDLEVRELATPGASIRVYPGTIGIANRATGIKDEMYVGRLPTEDVVAIASTGAGVPRSDLIIARVENPHLSGEPWDDPVDPAAGPYIFTRVISNVPDDCTTLAEAGRSGDSAVVLARIDIPASTSAITQAMITDLRNVARPRKEHEFNVVAPGSSVTLTSGTFINWPAAANLAVDIPSWATHVKLRAILGGIGYGATGNNGGAGWNVIGELRMTLDGAVSDVTGQTVTYNVSVESGADKTTLMAGSPALAIAAGNRGKPATIKIEGKKTSGSTSLVSNTQSMISVEAVFYNAPEANL